MGLEHFTLDVSLMYEKWINVGEYATHGPFMMGKLANSGFSPPTHSEVTDAHQVLVHFTTWFLAENQR